jgi:hypothetical protein
MFFWVYGVNGAVRIVFTVKNKKEKDRQEEKHKNTYEGST